MDWLWTRGGTSFGYREVDDLWTPDGRHVGRFHGGEVYGPGGNYLGELEGSELLVTKLDGKRQQLLTELVPAARHIAALADPSVTAPERLRALEDAARARGIEVSVYRVAKPEEIADAIDTAQASGAQALNVLASPLLYANRQLIIERTGTLKLPAIYQFPEIAEVGGLAAYGPRFAEIGRQSARQLVKIFRGAKPADLPVEQPDKFELVINLKTAEALGLTVPPLLLGQAGGSGAVGPSLRSTGWRIA
jgi:putative tryptophan/tyrosine transport system substrate-binding protein